MMVNFSYTSKISTLIEQREVTDETFLSDVLKETKNKKARTALVKNKVRQIIEEKAHLNPVYYEKMRERLYCWKLGNCFDKVDW